MIEDATEEPFWVSNFLSHGSFGRGARQWWAAEGGPAPGVHTFCSTAEAARTARGDRPWVDREVGN